MTAKVEIGFTEAGASAPFFTLGDSTLGVLGGTDGVLGGGEVLVDVSQFVKSYSISRGKSRDLGRYQAGQATVNFQNDLRTFDPTFEAGPYFGQIEPRRQIRISLDDVTQFEGTIDDWGISYEPGGNSISTAQAFDGFANLANIFLQDFDPDEEQSGTRINAALDNIDWPTEKRAIDAGNATLEGQPVENETPIFDYLQLVADSEPGEVFLDKSGNVRFVERNAGFSADRPVLSDTGDGILYTEVGVQFGTELLFNEITVANSTLTAQQTNNTSVALYGKRDLDRFTLLSNQKQLDDLAVFFSNRFSEPEFRFENVTIDLNTVTPAQREQLINIELADVVEVKFTPNDIPPTIQRFGRVIKTDQKVTPTEQILSLSFQSTQGALLVLGDAVFGKLGDDKVLGF